jgi:hypothetical protein
MSIIYTRNQRSKVLLVDYFMLVSCSVYSSTLKMEAMRSFEKSVYFHRTTQRYIPEDKTLQRNLSLAAIV